MLCCERFIDLRKSLKIVSLFNWPADIKIVQVFIVTISAFLLANENNKAASAVAAAAECVVLHPTKVSACVSRVLLNKTTKTTTTLCVQPKKRRTKNIEHQRATLTLFVTQKAPLSLERRKQGFFCHNIYSYKLPLLASTAGDSAVVRWSAKTAFGHHNSVCKTKELFGLKMSGNCVIASSQRRNKLSSNVKCRKRRKLTRRYDAKAFEMMRHCDAGTSWELTTLVWCWSHSFYAEDDSLQEPSLQRKNNVIKYSIIIWNSRSLVLQCSRVSDCILMHKYF